MTFLKAYQAYQGCNYDLCLKLLKELDDDTKKLDLQAQVHFKLKDYQKAYDIYKGLITKEDEFTSERKENLQILLICAQLEHPKSIKVETRDEVPSVEEIIDQVELVNLKDNSIRDVCSTVVAKKKVKKNRKRKIRLPKQYDPVAGPDPERWLPRRDRKGNAYKQKKRRQRPPNKKGKTRAK